MNADEDRVIIAICEIDSLFQGEINVGITRHDDFKTTLDKIITEVASNDEVVASFGA